MPKSFDWEAHETTWGWEINSRNNFSNLKKWRNNAVIQKLKPKPNVQSNLIHAKLYF